MDETKPIDIEALRARLSQSRGKVYWRSLEELADSEAFHELLRREFPRQALAASTLSRRDFLKLAAASLALAGLTACNPAPTGKIVPYVKQPEKEVPGNPQYYATAVTLGGYAQGVIVTSREGRPIKIEGNPDHPASLGATDAFAQAAILTLYDPDRSQTITHAHQPSTWETFTAELAAALEAQQAKQGAGLHILSGAISSSTLAGQVQMLLKRYPAARWHQYEAAGRENIRDGAILAFGSSVETQYQIDKADVILSLDADFLSSIAGGVCYTRQFADRRRVRHDKTTMNRLYVVESMPTITGAMADHRFPQRASQIEDFARAVAQQLGVQVSASGTVTKHNIPNEWSSALVSDLQRHKGTSLILAGPQQPPVVHALAHAMNDILGNAGHTVIYTDPVGAGIAAQALSLTDFVSDLVAGSVDIAILIDVNPVYDAPVDLDFAQNFKNAKLRIHLGLYADETADACDWHLPETHSLESWSDARAFDGTISIIQPLIAPLYGGTSPYELLTALLGQPTVSNHDIVKSYWQTVSQAANFDAAWQRALHDGYIAGSALPAKEVKIQANFDRPSTTQASGLEIIFQPDPTIYDGRFANNGWLQEQPKPITLLTWDNVAQISPALAQRLNLANEDLVELRYRDRSVQAPVWIQPGQPDESVTVTLGYGRSMAGRIGTGIGFNAYRLRTSSALWFDLGLKIIKLNAHYALATVQSQRDMAGRDLIRVATIQDYIKKPDFVRTGDTSPAGSMYPENKNTGYAWGMAIDESVCVGCNACIIACQAENNSPVVGKAEVQKGREMHWLRVDCYYSGSLDNPTMDFQPVPCMQCEDAPCEPVCPVGATTHSDEGLNDMVYNRCVGTKYCSNNCPYKVRHFNFFQYADFDTSSLKLLHNPEVTVRSRGVMEKCTYCVQRIQAGKIAAEREGRPVRDGEIKTACQAACPAQAITFGNINDPNSEVTHLKAEPHNYALLEELNTRPRTTYLGKVRNPNPEIGKA